MKVSKGNIGRLDDYVSQVENSKFGEDSLLSPTNDLQRLFDCDAATLFALVEQKG